MPSPRSLTCSHRANRCGSFVGQQRLRFGPFVLAMLMAVGGVSCVADGPQPPRRPKPQPIQVPAGTLPGIVQLNASPTAADTNNNGFADTITVTVYLFPSPPAPPVPMEATGDFLFLLEDDSGERLAEWPVDQAQARAAARRFAPGIGYHFELNINEVASDRIMRSWGNLSAIYRLPDGTTLPERGNVTIQIGPTRAIR